MTPGEWWGKVACCGMELLDEANADGDPKVVERVMEKLEDLLREEEAGGLTIDQVGKG